jgi:ABC-type bacteriocin/lantibiotic exporter with double-glycine peptidase domain
MKSLFTIALLLFALWFVYTHLAEIERATTGLTIPNISAQTSAVHSVQRVNQLSLSQYNSPAEQADWELSACAPAATTAVLNYYGGNYRVHDVLQVMIKNGDISADSGLQTHSGLAHTASRYHFNAVLNEADTLDHVIVVANEGKPVIVNWPPSRFNGGHFVVVTGGNASTVFLADSSSYNYPSLSRAKFTSFWGEPGFSAVLTPR